MNNRIGFTIVEVLIVVAIIGILAAVILSSLQDARDEGVAAKIKSEMTILAKRAQVDESQNFTYDVVCGSNGFATTSEITRIITSIERFSPGPVVCNSDTEMFAISAALSSTTFWCVDSEGTGKEIGAALGAAEFQCP